MIFASCKCMESPTLNFFCAYACNNWHLQLVQSHAHWSAAVAGVLPLSMPGNIHMQQTYSLHEATSTYTSHVLVSASLWVATPTNPSRYVFAYHDYTLLRRYLQLVVNILSKSVPQFTNPGHIRVWPGLLSGLSGHPGQQWWPGFSVDVYVYIILVNACVILYIAYFVSY